MVKSIQIEIKQSGDSTSQVDVRKHQITIDRPTEKGGNDRGPMGGELLLIGLGGCFMSNLLAAINARNIDISGVKTTVTATLADNPSRFTTIDVAVSAKCSDSSLLIKLITIAERSCVVSNTLQAGAQLTFKVNQRVVQAR